MKWMEPKTELSISRVCVCGFSEIFDRPKSRSFTWKVLVAPPHLSMRFPGLRSRWSMPMACAADSRVERFARQPQEIGERKGRARGDALQRLPLDQFHHDVRPLRVASEIMNRDDVRVLERGEVQWPPCPPHPGRRRRRGRR